MLDVSTASNGALRHTTLDISTIAQAIVAPTTTARATTGVLVCHCSGVLLHYITTTHADDMRYISDVMSSPVAVSAAERLPIP